MKKNDYKKVMEFKITLKDERPSIWRVIQVPINYSFWDLHVAILNSMGWLGGHLHNFRIRHPKTGSFIYIGLPDDEFGGNDEIPEWEEKISKWFKKENDYAYFTYDFGDNWEHIVRLNKILDRDKNKIYPICIKGKRACPPEDCGNYQHFLKIITNPKHPEYEEMREWCGLWGGENFDPEYFDIKEIYFEDPKQKLQDYFDTNMLI